MYKFDYLRHLLFDCIDDINGCWCYSTKMYGGAATKSAKTFQMVLNTLKKSRPAPPAPAGFGNAWRADLRVGKKVQFKLLFLCCTVCTLHKVNLDDDADQDASH